MQRLVTAATVVWGLAAPVSMAQPQAAAHHARPRLITRTAAAAPGMTIQFAVTFEIEEGWHLYWNGRNDSGFPPTIDLRLPEGWTAGPAVWPAPIRHALPGNLLDHVYEHRLTLVFPVHVPESATPGAKAEVSAAVSWMECKDVCLMADGEVALSVPIAAGDAAPSPDAALFDEAHRRTPVALPPEPGDIALRWEHDVLYIQSTGAEYMAFYPALEGAALVNPTEDGESKSGSLTLRFDWPAASAKGQGGGETQRVCGVLEVRHPQGKTLIHALDIAPGRTGSPPQPPTAPTGIR